jgi:hypothetical protein
VHDEKGHLPPAALGRLAAVKEVRRWIRATRLLAAGDCPRRGDAAAVDAAIDPADGRLHAHGWAANHVVTTTGTELRPGQEIVR